MSPRDEISWLRTADLMNGWVNEWMAFCKCTQKLYPMRCWQSTESQEKMPLRRKSLIIRGIKRYDGRRASTFAYLSSDTTGDGRWYDFRMEKGCIFLSPTSNGSLEFHRFAKVVRLNVSPSLSVDALGSSKIIPVINPSGCSSCSAGNLAKPLNSLILPSPTWSHCKAVAGGEVSWVNLKVLGNLKDTSRNVRFGSTKRGA